MQLLASALFLTLLQCSTAQNETSITPADCDTIETDAGVALDLVNRHRRDGYVFGLFRIVDAYEQHTEYSSILYLTLDVLETECSVLSGRHWESCEYSDAFSQVFGQCKIITYTSQMLKKNHQLYGFNCTVSPVPPDLIECKHCPVKAEVLEVTEQHKDIAAKALEKYNSEGNSTNYFKVDKVEKIVKLTGSSESHVLGFSIKETNCSKSAQHTDMQLECDFLHDWHAQVGFCKATISVSEEPKGTDINCELYHPWQQHYRRKCRYPPPGRPHRHPHPHHPVGHRHHHRHHHRHSCPPLPCYIPEDSEHHHNFSEEHQGSHEEHPPPPPHGGPHHHPHPPHHHCPPPPQEETHHPPPALPDDGPYTPPPQEETHHPTPPLPNDEPHTPPPPPQEETHHPPPPSHHGPHCPHPPPHHHGPHHLPHPSHHGPDCPPPPHHHRPHHPPHPHHHGPHCPPPPPPHHHGPHHPPHPHHHGPHCPPSPPPHHHEPHYPSPPPPGHLPYPHHHYYRHHCNKASSSGKHFPFQIIGAVYRIPVLNQQDSLTLPTANFLQLSQSNHHFSSTGEGTPFTSSSLEKKSGTHDFPHHLSQSKSCPGKPKLHMPQILPLFPYKSMAETVPK
nr:PREDICTED: histidine-rich glycoprotein [Apteryx mantelli mantelli]